MWNCSFITDWRRTASGPLEWWKLSVCVSASRTGLWPGSGSGTSVLEDHGRFFLQPWETRRSETAGTSVELLFILPPFVLYPVLFLHVSTSPSSFFSSFTLSSFSFSVPPCFPVCLFSFFISPFIKVLTPSFLHPFLSFLVSFSHYLLPPPSDFVSCVSRLLFWHHGDHTSCSWSSSFWRRRQRGRSRETLTQRERESFCIQAVMWPVSPVSPVSPLGPAGVFAESSGGGSGAGGGSVSVQEAPRWEAGLLHQ